MLHRWTALVLIGAALCAGTSSTTAQMTLPEFSELCWVAYAPTGFNPIPRPAQYPPWWVIEDDLDTLRSAGFTGIVTYGVEETLNQIPYFAQRVGFQAIIIGIFTVQDADLARGIAAKNPITVGYVVGNEGLDKPPAEGGYTFDQLQTAMDYVRSQTNLPVTTSEEVGDYYVNLGGGNYATTELIDVGDWIFPNVFPFYNTGPGNRLTDPIALVQATLNEYNILAGLVSDRTIIFKEVGLPSGGYPDLNEARQAEYFDRLKQTIVPFMYFEAFNQTWKASPQSLYEGQWGLFDENRGPKLAGLGRCGSPPMPNYFTSSVTLTWAPVTWATNYTLQIDYNPVFRSPTLRSIPASANASYSVTLPDGLYYWRVRAEGNGQVGLWSVPQGFVLNVS